MSDSPEVATVRVRYKQPDNDQSIMRETAPHHHLTPHRSLGVPRVTLAQAQQLASELRAAGLLKFDTKFN